MKLDCRDRKWIPDPNLVVIDADTGFMIEQVVAVDDEEGWIIVNVCDRRGNVVIDREADEIARVKLYRPVKVVDLRSVPKDQRRGVVNLTRTYGE